MGRLIKQLELSGQRRDTQIPLGAREVGLSTDHKYYRTGEIVADVSNRYLIRFDQREADQLPPMELLTLKELSGRCQNCEQKLANLARLVRTGSNRLIN